MMKSVTTKSLEETVLKSATGFEVGLLNLGATIRYVRVPTSSGHIDAVLSLPLLSDYLVCQDYVGSTIGRYANRISRARFELDGTEYVLEANEVQTGNCLHGGSRGFHKQFWKRRPSQTSDCKDTQVSYQYVSPDGESGFPGTVTAVVTYTLQDPARLEIKFSATTDKDTVISLANHAYFNLDTNQSSIDAHRLRIFARQITPTEANGVPVGSVEDVSNTPYDLQSLTVLDKGRDIEDEVEGSKVVLDHNFVLPEDKGELRLAAELFSKESGVRMNLYTTQPGLQCYTGDYLRAPLMPRQGIALEAQGFPDAPNQPEFPSCLLKAGSTYEQTTVYEFIVSGDQ